MSGKTQKSVRTENRHRSVVLTAAVLAFSTAKCGPEGPMGTNNPDSGVVQRDANPPTDSRVNSDVSTSMCNPRDLGEVPDFGRRGVRSPLVLNVRSGDTFRMRSVTSGSTPVTHTYLLTTYSHADYLRSVNQTPSGELPSGASPINVAYLASVDSNCRQRYDGSRPIGYVFMTGDESTTFTTFNAPFAGYQVTFQLRSVSPTEAQFYIMRAADSIAWNPSTDSVTIPSGSAVDLSGFNLRSFGGSRFRFGANGSSTVFDVSFATITKSGMVPDQQSIAAVSGDSLRYYVLAPSSQGPEQLYRFDVTGRPEGLIVRVRAPAD